MAEKNEKKEQTRRTQIEDLPQEEKELSKDDQKKVKGGAGVSFLIDVAANKPKQ